MRVAIIALFMLLLAACAWAQVDPSEVWGTWSKFDEYLGQPIVVILTANEDNTYSMLAIMGEQQFPIEAGTYTIEGTTFAITIGYSLRVPEDVGKTITYTDAAVVGDVFSYKNEAQEVTSWVRGTDPTATAVEASSWGQVKTAF